MNKLAMILFDMMEKALQVVETKDISGMNYYPPCPQLEIFVGLAPHSDFVGLTILLQVNEVKGLHITKEETWISVKPLPNAFVVNIRDILEVLIDRI
ncbi:hypothetical protein MKX03_025308 [Papaver bracteatum]|nr:hypothetical protein MKX03_025308 [Papaver bracteatum]